MFKYFVIAAILFAAFVTNPSEQNFKSKVENELFKKLNANEGGNFVTELITSSLVGSVIWNLVQVDYQDFKLCSTFEMRIGNKEIKFLGIFGQIIPISGSNSFTELSEQLNR
jgi:hypothetical protein